jgi:hypothetical protein
MIQSESAVLEFVYDTVCGVRMNGLVQCLSGSMGLFQVVCFVVQFVASLCTVMCFNKHKWH